MSYKLETLEEKKNPLIDRVELTIKIEHFGKGTPNKLDLKKKVAASQGVDEKLTIVRKIKTNFGSTKDIGKFYIYDNLKELEFFESFHIRVRNLPKEKRAEILKLKRKKEPYKHLFE